MSDCDDPFDPSCANLKHWLRNGSYRRNFLQAISLFTGGTWLTRFAEALATEAMASSSKQGKPKSLLILWLQGGPSQLETFDPHPGSWIGGSVRSIPTTIRDIEISELLPATAEQLNQVTLIRSMVSKEGDHERATYHLKTGWRPEATIVHPSIGAIACHQTLNNIEIPRHISISPSEWPSRGGFLGASYDAFQIGDPASPIPNLTGQRSEARTQGELASIVQWMENEFERGRLKNLERERTLHRLATSNALAMMSSEQLNAFRIDEEAAGTISKFGGNAFGRGCLAAVRLLETGVRCVEVELNGWDTHINNHEFQSNRAKILDPALAATLQLLQERELLDDTIVFCGGEFGRTPIINAAGGRDHWPHGFSVMLAGGPFRKGYVHGSTNGTPDRDRMRNREGRSVDPTDFTSHAVSVPDLHATILHAMGIDPALEIMTPIGRPLRWSDGKVVPELLDKTS